MADRPDSRRTTSSPTERADDAHDTLLVVAGVTAAVLAVGAWTLAAGAMRGLDAFTFAVLVGAAFLAEHIAVPITPRSMFHASTPVVLLTGLLGGPLAGAVAGAVTAVPGIVERRDVKRSLTYGGIGSLQGLLAGLAGLVTLDVGDLAPQVVSAALASALFLTSNVVSRLLIGRSRHIPRTTSRPGTVPTQSRPSSSCHSSPR